jgi:hypothetical protein
MPGMLLKATQYLMSAFKAILILSQGLPDDKIVLIVSLFDSQLQNW